MTTSPNTYTWASPSATCARCCAGTRCRVSTGATALPLAGGALPAGPRSSRHR
jgi:hypothetical protein